VTPTLKTSETTYLFGSASDPWGHSWKNTELANLRVRVIDVASSTSRDFSLDWIALRVHHSAAPPPPPPPPGPAPGGVEPAQVLSDYDPDPAATNWVVADAPDPFVLRVDPSFCAPDGGSPTVCYYAYTTNVVFNPVPVWRSSDLTHWFLAGVDDPDPTAPADPNVWPDGSAVDPSHFARWSLEAFDKWAPAVLQAGGQYVMWYSARNGHGPHCLGIATASSPDGPFRDVINAPRVCRDSQGGVIDASTFTDSDGTHYLTYKTEGTSTQPSRIYAATLAADGMTLGTEALLLERQGGWELPRIEGPTLWRSPAGLFLFYSGGDWETSGYAVGVARCTSPLGPCSRIYTTPVLASRGSALGPGGQTPFIDDAGVLKVAFHAWSAPAVGYSNNGARSLRFLEVTFPDGKPKIG
jgi:beta-xylosidase